MMLVDSDKWEIARTIYASLTAKGKVVITKFPYGVSRLSLKFNDLNVHGDTMTIFYEE